MLSAVELLKSFPIDVSEIPDWGRRMKISNSSVQLFRLQSAFHSVVSDLSREINMPHSSNELQLRLQKVPEFNVLVDDYTAIDLHVVAWFLVKCEWYGVDYSLRCVKALWWADEHDALFSMETAFPYVNCSRVFRDVERMVEIMRVVSLSA